MERIDVVRMVGLFCRYGFVFDGKEVVGKEVVRVIGEGELEYLDAFRGGEAEAQGGLGIDGAGVVFLEY